MIDHVLSFYGRAASLAGRGHILGADNAPSQSMLVHV